MTKKRRGTARWTGDLDSGEGHVETESALLDAAFDAAHRYADSEQTNPEELIGAAHAACYSMSLSQLVSEAGYEPDNVRTDADVEVDPDTTRIEAVHLTVSGRADDIDEETFQRIAEQAKQACPVSGALGSLTIELEASLETPTPG